MFTGRDSGQMRATESADKQLSCVFVCKWTLVWKMWGCRGLFVPPSVSRHGVELTLNFLPQFPHCQTSFQRVLLKAAWTDHYPAMKPFRLHCMVARTLGDGMRHMGGFDVQSCKSFYMPSSQLTLEADAVGANWLKKTLPAWSYGLTTRGRNRSDDEKSKKRSNIS